MASGGIQTIMSSYNKTENIIKARAFNPPSRKLKAQWAKAELFARSQRTPEEQLKLLNVRLGFGLGAAKERAKLLKQIDKAA
jgi:hypothetical protein